MALALRVVWDDFSLDSLEVVIKFSNSVFTSSKPDQRMESLGRIEL